jgi:hypothetical protein
VRLKGQSRRQFLLGAPGHILYSESEQCRWLASAGLACPALSYSYVNMNKYICQEFSELNAEIVRMDSYVHMESYVHMDNYVHMDSYVQGLRLATICKTD